MRPFALLSALALTCSVLAQPTEFQRHAGNVDVRGVPIRHNHRSHPHQVRGDRSSNKAGKLKKRSNGKKNKRCVAKTSTSSALPASTSAAASSSTNTHSTKTTTSTAAASTSSGSSDSGDSGSSGDGKSGGVVKITDKKCGFNNPSAKPGNDVGPNGQQDWMNCGLNTGSGWTPPLVTLDDLVYVPLADALKMKPNQFEACGKYLSIFQASAKKYGIPDILLASIAMQESSCNPKAFSAGSHGLFQLSSDLCKPYSDCFDPASNTDGGANYIKTLLKSRNNNILQVMGEYNGWEPGIKPASVQNKPCAMRQNWNYLQQLFNTWMQGLNGYETGNVHDGCNGADNA